MGLAGRSCVGLIVTGGAVVGLGISFVVAVRDGKQGALTVDRFQRRGRQTFERWT